MSDEFVYYTASPDHRPFIIGTWMKAMRTAPEYLDMTDDDYYTWSRKHATLYVERYPTLVALDPDDLDTVIAFLNYSDHIGHFTYVRKDFRENGIYKKLKELSGITAYSHRSGKWRHRRGSLRYIPWFVAS